MGIRFLDGSKIQRKFNKTDLVGHIYKYVKSQIPADLEDHPEFLLVSNFPRKVFDKMDETLEVTQQILKNKLINKFNSTQDYTLKLCYL